MSQHETQPQPQRTSSAATALKFLTAVVALGTVALHLIGDIRHRHYLNYWGIDAGLFPKSTDWILINGYYGLFDRFVVIIVVMMENLTWFVCSTVILSLYVFILRLPVGTGGATPAWLQKRPEGFRRLLRHLLLTAMFLFAIPCAMYLVTGFMAVPAALGETAGIAAAEREAEHYRKGCAASKVACVQLKRDGELIATGFLLDSSPSYIAILDGQSQKARVIPLDKIELVSARSMKAHAVVRPEER